MRNLPIRRKMTVITMVTTTVALALACAAFTVVDQIVLRRDLVGELTSTAKMIGFNAASALSFNDATSAAETLRSLSAERNITGAWLYGRDGRLLANYFRDGERAHLVAPAEREVGATFARNAVEMISAIDFDGEVIGTLHVQSDLVKLRDRLFMSAVIFCGVMMGGGVIAYLLVSRLQRVISRPVQQLAEVAARVATENNYTVRAEKQGNDEVGTLIDAFNEMLVQIQARDAALLQARDELEKRVEARTHELASSVSLLNATLDSTTDGIVATNHQGEVVCCNSRFADMWSIPPELLARRRSADLLAHARTRVRDPERFSRLVAEAHAHAGAATGEVIELVDGRTFERYVHAQRVDGRDVGVVVSYRNVTGRRRAEEQVARERARFKFIFDAVPVGISLVVDDENMPPVVNPAHSRITGISPEELQNPLAFERASHPDDFQRQRELVRRYKRGEVDELNLEKRYIHRDGRVVWVALSRRMFVDPTTGQKQSVTTVIDISALKAAQEDVARERARFKFIFDSVPVGISLVAVGRDNSHLVNPAHVWITGVSAEDSNQPGIFARVSHPDDVVKQQAFIQKYVSGEIDHYTIEKRYLHPNGLVVWASLTSRLFTDPLTGQKQSITTLVDVTERKNAEAKLAETHKQLLDTSRQAGMAEVATGVLHNVGNVLNSVNVSTTVLGDLVRQSKVDNVAKLGTLLAEHEADPGAFFAHDPRGKKIPGFVQTLAKHLGQEQRVMATELDSLRKSVEHIKEIVAMQQSYAKVSGVSEAVAVVELVEDALRMNSGAMARHDVALVRDFRANPQVDVEKHKVLQILVNLLRNAKYACDDTGRKDKQVTVRTLVEDGIAKIAVIDNGVGIPAENLTRIFSHGFTTRKHGHGFGLHSGALAAKELGGKLLARSEGPGQGAMFVLELPLKAEAKAA